MKTTLLTTLLVLSLSGFMTACGKKNTVDSSQATTVSSLGTVTTANIVSGVPQNISGVRELFTRAEAYADENSYANIGYDFMKITTSTDRWWIFRSTTVSSFDYDHSVVKNGFDNYSTDYGRNKSELSSNFNSLMGSTTNVQIVFNSGYVYELRFYNASLASYNGGISGLLFTKNNKQYFLNLKEPMFLNPSRVYDTATGATIYRNNSTF